MRWRTPACPILSAVSSPSASQPCPLCCRWRHHHTGEPPAGARAVAPAPRAAAVRLQGCGANAAGGAVACALQPGSCDFWALEIMAGGMRLCSCAVQRRACHTTLTCPSPCIDIRPAGRHWRRSSALLAQQEGPPLRPQLQTPWRRRRARAAAHPLPSSSGPRQRHQRRPRAPRRRRRPSSCADAQVQVAVVPVAVHLHVWQVHM